MEILYTNCVGLDVQKKTVKVCVLTHISNGQPQKEFRTYFTTTRKSAGWNATALFGCCMLHASAIVETVPCARSVKKAVLV